MAVIATDKEIIGCYDEFKCLITTWYRNAHKLLNYGPITPKILSARDYDSIGKYNQNKTLLW